VSFGCDVQADTSVTEAVLIIKQLGYEQRVDRTFRRPMILSFPQLCKQVYFSESPDAFGYRHPHRQNPA
jgi:hypothetical protein